MVDNAVQHGIMKYMTLNDRIEIRIKSKTMKSLENLAKQSDRKPSAVARIIIEKYLENQKTQGTPAESAIKSLQLSTVSRPEGIIA